MLVSHLNKLKKDNPDDDRYVLVVRGTSDRLRAIILTTLSTVGGLIPLAYGIGGTDVYMAPLALALGWGLFFATPLTLLLIPSLYMIGQDIGGLTGRVFRRG